MKITDLQRKSFLNSLKSYKKIYLGKKNSELDESATRIMVNNFLSIVLGYTELEEIKTEYAIRGTYADYVIESDRKKHFIVEVKAISLNLSDKHLRQALNYGANEGIEWIVLTNGRQWQLYRIIFSKPIREKQIFDFDLSDLSQLKKSVDMMFYLTKRNVEKGNLENLWSRFQALEPQELAKRLYNEDIIRLFKRSLKQKTGLLFSNQDVLDSIYELVSNEIETVKPTLRKVIAKKKK